MATTYALRPAWTPLTILLMVLGFIVFWPLGLAMLAYILWGDRISEVRQHFEGAKRDWSHRCGSNRRSYSHSGNVAFDEYRQREMKRLEEERRRLDEELREFESFMHDLRRARDQEEFDRFMRDRSDKPRRDGDSIDL
jgi:biopolymer transport protein ExbB/TolQ